MTFYLPLIAGQLMQASPRLDCTIRPFSALTLKGYGLSTVTALKRGFGFSARSDAEQGWGAAHAMHYSRHHAACG